MSRTGFAIAAAAAFVSASTHAAPDPLSVRSAVQTALDRNPGILQARAKVEEADHRSGLAYSYFFPTLSATGSAFYKKDAANNPAALFGASPYNSYNLGLQITQPIFVGGALT